jgi:hypothetical protein
VSVAETRREAFESIDPSHLRTKVLDSIRASGRAGRTCDEVEEMLAMSHQTASARVNELAKLALIVDSGRKRKTRSGRGATVWVVVMPPSPPPAAGAQGQLF